MFFPLSSLPFQSLAEFDDKKNKTSRLNHRDNADVSTKIPATFFRFSLQFSFFFYCCYIVRVCRLRVYDDVKREVFR